MYHTHNDFGNNTQRSLGTDEQACEIIAWSILCPVANLHNVAFRSNDFQSQHVVGCNTINKCVRATCVFANIASDSTGTLAAWIGHVIVSLWVQCITEVEIDESRLHNGAQVIVIDLEDTIHASKNDNDTTINRNCAPA